MKEKISSEDIARLKPCHECINWYKNKKGYLGKCKSKECDFSHSHFVRDDSKTITKVVEEQSNS